MSAQIDYGLPSFRTLYDAILSAPSTVDFSLYALKDPTTIKILREAPHLQDFLQALRVEAEQANLEPITPLTFRLFHQFETTGERVGYEMVYFTRRKRLASLTLAIILDERDDYLDSFHDLLWAICNEYTWTLPAHIPVGMEAVQAYRLPPDQIIDLFASETAHMLVEIRYLMGDKLSDWLSYRIGHEIERRIFQPLFNHPQTFKWERDAHNWAAVCGGSIGMTALLLESDRERLVGMLNRAISAMDSFLSGFGTDGGCPEGISYWVYGFGYYVYFSDMLARFTAGKINLLSGEHAFKIAQFPQAVSLGGGHYINYSDASETATINAGLASYLIQQLGVNIPDVKTPDFHADHIYRWAHITRDLVWTNPDALYHPVEDGTYYLDRLAWVIDKRKLQAIPITFSAKGGHNDEPHNHNDLGHFIIQAGDDSLLIDLGAGVYTRQYFSEGRYDNIHTSAYGHSLPTINGNGQIEGASHRAEVLAYHPYPNSITYVLDLTKAYAVPEIQSFIRAFDWSVDPTTSSATLILKDVFHFHQPSSVEEYFITDICPHITAGVITWQGKQSTLTLQFSHHDFDATVETINTQNHYLEAITVYRLRLMSREPTVKRDDCLVFRVDLDE